MLHELAHMWFGDSVSPYEWSDLWNNEGHASWYEFLYAESRGQLAEDTEDWPDPQGYATFEELMRAIYAHGDEWRRDYGPVAAIFSGDPSTCSASRSTTEARSCSTHCARGSAPPRSSAWKGPGCSAMRASRRAPADYIALATEVSGVDVTAFLRDWLYGTKTPPMPGRPDWTVNPIK